MPILEDFIDKLTTHWQEQVAKSNEDVSALREKARHGVDYYNKSGHPYAAEFYANEFAPLVDKVGGSIPMLLQLADVLKQKGYRNIVSSPPYPGVAKVPEDALGVTRTSWTTNLFNKKLKLKAEMGVKPKPNFPKLPDTLFHEFTHFMQEHPETAQVLAAHRNYPEYKESTGNAYLDNYYNNPEEIQARQMASAFMEDLFGIRTADKEPSGINVLRELLGHGQSLSPTDQPRQKPDMF
jgi:hypothetical protein